MLWNTRIFYKEKVCKKMRFRWPTKNVKEAEFPKLSVFVGQKSIFRYYCIQNVKDGIQIGVYKINNESVAHFNQFISVKVKKYLRKSQPRFREKTRTSRLRKNGGFPITKTMYS